MQSKLLILITLFFLFVTYPLPNIHQFFTSEGVLVVVDQGKAEYSIVIKGNASRAEKFAANEFQKYISAVSGANLPIRKGITQIPSMKESHMIVICSSCPKLFKFPEKSTQDAFVIRNVGKSVVLSGKSDRGTLYSVYTFLEKFLDIKWLAPGIDGEIIPRKQTISLKIPLSKLEVPDFKFRIAGGFHSKSYIDWAIKNKLQIACSSVQKRNSSYLLKRGGCVKNITIHSFFDILPPNRYFKEHPEYFSFLNGKWVNCGQINVTNPNVRDVIVHKTSQYFAKNPSAQFFSITPNDGYGWSQDPKSRRIDLNAGQGSFRNHPVVSDRYFNFIDKIAREIQRKYPDNKYIFSLAYLNYVFPPKTINQLRSNVVVMIAHYTPADYAHPIYSRASEANQQFYEIIRKWREKTENLWFYSYTVKYAWDNLPYPIAKRLGRDIKLLNKLNFQGFYSQGAENRWGQVGPHFYIMAKLLWNANQDIEEILNNYFKGMFGVASEEMRAFYNLLSDSLSSPEVYINSHPASEAPKFLTEEVFEQSKKYLSEARKKCELKSHCKHVKEMQLPLQYAKKYLKMRNALNRFQRTWELDNLKEAYNQYSAIEKLIKSNKKIDSLPLSAVEPSGYFTLDRYFRDYSLYIDLVEGKYQKIKKIIEEKIIELRRKASDLTRQKGMEKILSDYPKLYERLFKLSLGKKEVTAWDLIYKTSFEQNQLKGFQVKKKDLDTRIAKDQGRSLVLSSGLNNPSQQLVSSAITPPIDIKGSKIIKVEVYVYSPQASSKNRRGIVMNLIGYDSTGDQLWPSWRVENSKSYAPNWQKLVLFKKLNNPKVSKIKIRLGISRGMGKVYFDKLKVFKANISPKGGK